MKNLFILLSLALFSIKGSSQEDISTIFWNNYSVVNPAASGFDNSLHTSITHRNQWTGFGGEPKTTTFDFGYKLDKVNSGIGLFYVRDVLGQTTNNMLQVNYNYQFEFSEESKLSVGTSIGIRQVAFSNNFITPDSGGEDDFLNQPASQTKMNINFGLNYKINNLTLGFSSTQVAEAVYEKAYYSATRYYWLMSSYEFDVKEKWQVIPSVVAKTDVVSAQIILNTRAVFDNKLWVGASYNVNTSFSPMLGGIIKDKFKLGYAYGFSTSAIKQYSSGTHELALFFGLN